MNVLDWAIKQRNIERDIFNATIDMEEKLVAAGRYEAYSKMVEYITKQIGANNG